MYVISGVNNINPPQSYFKDSNGLRNNPIKNTKDTKLNSPQSLQAKPPTPSSSSSTRPAATTSATASASTSTPPHSRALTAIPSIVYGQVSKS